jgi:Flavodoxin-like fold
MKRGRSIHRPNRYYGSEFIDCFDISLPHILRASHQAMETVMKILHLDSSITGKQSVSHTLSTEIVEALAARDVGAEVTYHDLANEPLLHLSPAHLAAFQGAPVESAALGACRT